MRGLPQAGGCLPAWGRKALSHSLPPCSLEGDSVSRVLFSFRWNFALEDSVFYVTPLLPPPLGLTSWFPPVQTVLATGQDLDHSWQGQGLRTAKGEAGSGKLTFLLGQGLGPLLWGLQCVRCGGRALPPALGHVSPGSKPGVDT